MLCLAALVMECYGRTNALMIETHELEREHIANRSRVERPQLLQRRIVWDVLQHRVCTYIHK